MDTLIACSTNCSNGPFIYNADSKGTFSYDTAISYADTGISIKYGNGILEDSVIGINQAYGTYNNRVPGDVLLDSSDWVDFNTLGHDSDKLDMHYEMSIPLSGIGITASDISDNGIGVMIVSTFGTSGMDCLPYDYSMYDNADQAYSQQENNSMEKEDEDHITVPFARIGKLSGTSQPTTAAPTTVAPTTAQPTTVAPTTVAPTTAQPTTAMSNLSVTATSNLFPQDSATLSQNAETVTVTYDLKSSMSVVNGLWYLNYDSSKLSFDVSKNSDLMPYIDCVTNTSDGIIKGVFSNAGSPYDFSSSKNFVKVTFDVIGTGSTEVNLDIVTLSVGYKENGETIFKNAVAGSLINDLSKVSGFENSAIVCNTTISETPVSVVYGDVNGDGYVSIDDATLVQKYIADIIDFTDDQVAAADTDHDGDISISDVTRIQKYVADIIDSLN